MPIFHLNDDFPSQIKKKVASLNGYSVRQFYSHEEILKEFEKVYNRRKMGFKPILKDIKTVLFWQESNYYRWFANWGEASRYRW